MRKLLNFLPLTAFALVFFLNPSARAELEISNLVYCKSESDPGVRAVLDFNDNLVEARLYNQYDATDKSMACDVYADSIECRGSWVLGNQKVVADFYRASSNGQVNEVHFNRSPVYGGNPAVLVCSSAQ